LPAVRPFFRFFRFFRGAGSHQRRIKSPSNRRLLPLALPCSLFDPSDSL
jgi:hypothetical protein